MARSTEVAQRVLTAVTHYDALGVPVAADLRTIKLAHRDLSGLFHPDRCTLPCAHDVMARANEAWDVLSDSERRRKYDLLNRVANTACQTCNGSGKVWRQKGFKAKVFIECPNCKGSG